MLSQWENFANEMIEAKTAKTRTTLKRNTVKELASESVFALESESASVLVLVLVIAFHQSS